MKEKLVVYGLLAVYTIWVVVPWALAIGAAILVWKIIL